MWREREQSMMTLTVAVLDVSVTRPKLWVKVERFKNEKYRQYTYNVTLRRVRVTIVAVEKQ